MNTTQAKWTLMLVGLGMLTACTGNEPGPETPKNSVLAFRSELRSMSRATETEFELNDEISLFAVKPGTDESSVVLQPSGNFYDNIRFRFNGEQFTSDPMIYKANDAKLAYFAIYPYMANASDEFTFAVKTDQSTTENYKASDLCTASTGYMTESTPTLTFSHRLSNIVITLEGNNLGGQISVELINSAVSASCNLNNLSFRNDGTRSNVKCNEYGTNTFRAIVAPQTYTEGQEFLKVTLNGREHIMAANRTLEFTSGRQVELTLRVVNEELVIVSGDINPWNSEQTIEYVVPTEILEKLDDHIDIHRGVNPPNIEGCYLVEPFITVYCEDQGNGGFDPGYEVSPINILFNNQDMALRTLDYNSVSVHTGSYASGNGAFISGEGNDFTVYFNTEGYSSNIYVKQALVISGTKTDNGIANLQYAFVMVDKGDDPENLLMAKGIYRVFTDGDAISTVTEWPGMPNSRSVFSESPAFELIRTVKK